MQPDYCIFVTAENYEDLVKKINKKNELGYVLQVINDVYLEVGGKKGDPGLSAVMVLDSADKLCRQNISDMKDRLDAIGLTLDGIFTQML